MAEPSVQGDFARLSGATIWWSAATPDEIHLTFDDPDLTHPRTGPGMQVTFSTNVKSANYHPSNFNRCAAVLRKHGKPAPAVDAEEGNRRLDKRGFSYRAPRRSSAETGPSIAEWQTRFDALYPSGAQVTILDAERPLQFLTPRLLVLEGGSSPCLQAFAWGSEKEVCFVVDLLEESSPGAHLVRTPVGERNLMLNQNLDQAVLSELRAARDTWYRSGGAA